MKVWYKVILLVFFGWSILFLPASGGEINCDGGLKDIDIFSYIDSDDAVCPELFVGWDVRIHLNKSGSGPLTDGTLLHLLHLSQPDYVPESKWPLPISISPLNDQIWIVHQILDGKVIPDQSREKYYIWAPGKNRYTVSPYGVDWGDDNARVFRCLPVKGGNCITYYTIADCEASGDTDAYISVRRPAISPVESDTFANFYSIDALSVELSNLTRAALCRGK